MLNAAASDEPGPLLGTVIAASPPAPAAPRPGSAPELRVTVDPRVELLSVIFRLAGNPEYNQARVDSYAADAEKHFDAVRGHQAIKLAQQLRADRGVSYDACMSMAVHLSDAYELQPLVPLKPWPEALDQRWTPEDAAYFLSATRQFVKEASFREFIEEHQQLFDTTTSRMRVLMEQNGHLEWFHNYFGERPQAAFTLALALLNGGQCYGPHCRDAAGKEELYCILGVWQTDDQGLPQFTHEMLGTIVHEFCHSYANAIIDRHYSELATAAGKLYQPVAEQMRSQAYGNAQTMLRESLVRACTVRYHRQYDGEQAARHAIQEEKNRGFVWTEKLSNVLAGYEAQRDRYPTLESFAPRLVEFFNGYTQEFDQEQTALAAKRPHVVSLRPANGATDVDPEVTQIQVLFDRPMKDRSWSLVGGGPHCPETTGQPHYDSGRTMWTVPVKLKPDWSYEFRLNSGNYNAFRSEEGVPLQSVFVTFTTAKSAKADPAPSQP